MMSRNGFFSLLTALFVPALWRNCLTGYLLLSSGLLPDFKKRDYSGTDKSLVVGFTAAGGGRAGTFDRNDP
jgi:hypothetical protein